MRQVNKIRTFYNPHGEGIVIAFVNENQRSRLYAYSYRRYIKLCNLTMEWDTTYTKQAITFRRESLDEQDKIILDGTFPCPECNFSEKHLASCSHRIKA